MKTLFRLRWWTFFGAVLFISMWVMDYSAELSYRERGADCWDGQVRAWHPAIFIGAVLVAMSAIGFAAHGYPNRSKELVG